MSKRIAPLTFADVYKQKWLQRPRSTTSGLTIIPRNLMSHFKCSTELTNFATSLGPNNASSYGKMKGLLNVLPKQLYQTFNDWVDNRNMDVLQLCIVFDRADIIMEILANDELFPESHLPTHSPYAHLAAWLGHMDSLEVLLTNRPGFYFKTSKPQHAIKIPKDLEGRVKSKEKSIPVNRWVKKMLKKVGEAPLKAERTLGTTTQRKKWDLDAMDNSSELVAVGAKTSRRKHKSQSKKSPGVLFNVSEHEKFKHAQAADVTGVFGRELVSTINLCAPGLGKGEHIITVYNWDFLEDEPEGFKMGTGAAVKLIRPEERQRRRMKQVKLPKLDDVRTLNQQSRIAMNQRANVMSEIAFNSKSRLEFMSTMNVGKSKSHIASDSSYSDKSSNQRSGINFNGSANYSGHEDIASSITKTTSPTQRNISTCITKTSPFRRNMSDSNSATRDYSQRNVTHSKNGLLDTNWSSFDLEKSRSPSKMFKRIEHGVRTIKRYKDFKVVFDSRKLQFDDDKDMNKTPLTLAAEKGHLECVKYLLQSFLLKQHPTLTSDELLTLGTKVRSPEALAILLSDRYSREDFQSAVLTALRDFYPACLTVLLNSESKSRPALFDGENLFHILYSQSLSSDFHYDMMPEMTRTLINCKEEVNARGPESTHPMYTLISCAFNIRASRQCLYYLECLKILLGARANPHYNELKEEAQSRPNVSLSREFYFSAVHCIFANAFRSTKFFEKPYWSRVIMRKFIECLVVNDKTPRRILNDVLFTYMDFVTQLGLDRRVLRFLFRYGANPDYKYREKYAINHFFDEMIPFLTQFEVSSLKTSTMLDSLMMVCDAMSPECLHEAFVTFLNEHLLRTPLQALSLTRKFCYELNQEIRNPRSLVKLTGNFIWKTLRRNSISAGKLPLDESLMCLIIPT